MKKLSFILCFVFMACMAFAQNTASVTEDGDNNKSYVNQAGTDNKATVNQVGDLNTADVADKYASSLYPVLTNTKGITQIGDKNVGSIEQINSFTGEVLAGPIAGMYQNGSKNNASISQKGNTAYLQVYAWAKQVGNENTSIQEQQKGGYEFSHVFQTGNKNNAKITQIDGYAENASILQNGNENYALQSQGDAIAYTHDNLAEVTQLTNSNWSEQYQIGSNNTAKTIQKTGETNIARITQSSNAEIGANADIVQDGDHNTLMGVGIDPMATSLKGSTLNLDQIGSHNTLQLQQDNGASATVYQNGSYNTSVVIQN